MSERSKGACDVPKSMPTNTNYLDNYDRIFKKKEIRVTYNLEGYIKNKGVEEALKRSMRKL